jgi:hypothetical protein
MSHQENLKLLKKYKKKIREIASLEDNKVLSESEKKKLSRKDDFLENIKNLESQIPKSILDTLDHMSKLEHLTRCCKDITIINKDFYDALTNLEKNKKTKTIDSSNHKKHLSNFNDELNVEYIRETICHFLNSNSINPESMKDNVVIKIPILDNKFAYIVGYASRGGFKPDNDWSTNENHKCQKITFSHGLYICITKSDNTITFLGKKNIKRTNYLEGEWFCGEGNKFSSWYTDKTCDNNLTNTMLITLSYKENKWQFSKMNTMYPTESIDSLKYISTITDDLKIYDMGHQVAGDLLCILGHPSFKNPQDKTLEVLKYNTFLRLKNRYLPDKDHKVMCFLK